MGFGKKSKKAGGSISITKEGGNLVEITEHKGAVVIDYTKTYKIFVKLTKGQRGAWRESHISNVVKIDDHCELIMGKTTDGNNFLGRIDGSPQKFKLPIDKKVRIGAYTVLIKLTNDPGAPKIPKLENMGDGNDPDEAMNDDDMPVDSGAAAYHTPPQQQQQYQQVYQQPSAAPSGYHVTSTDHAHGVGWRLPSSACFLPCQWPPRVPANATSGRF